LAYLVVLDGEKNEALRVLLEEGLVGLFWLDGCSSGLLLDLLDLGDNRLGVLDGDGVGVVFLVGGIEVELLNGRLYLESLNGSGSLCSERVLLAPGLNGTKKHA